MQRRVSDAAGTGRLRVGALLHAESFGAIYAKTHSVVRLRKAFEEIEERAALPRLQVDLLFSSDDRFLHVLMLTADWFR